MSEGFFPLRENARIESFQPHMHLRGKAMMVEAVLPSGQRRSQLRQQLQLQLDDHLRLRRRRGAAAAEGHLLKVTAWHDNTSAKKSNPDPNQWVGWGDRTVDEMAHAWINIVYMKDDDYKAEVDKRKAGTTTMERERQ